MKVVTFFSFKGGVGRSTALGNVAARLAERGRSVVALDADLEAPGLSYWREWSGIDPAQIQGGLAEWLVEPDDPATQLVGRMIHCPGRGDGHWLVPTGRLARDRGYRVEEALDAIVHGGPESGLAERLKDQLRRTPDGAEVEYLLVDGRTGLGDLGSFSLLGLGEMVVLIAGLAEPSRHGTSLVVEHLARQSKGLFGARGVAPQEAGAMLVLSPVPEEPERERQEALERMYRSLHIDDPDYVVLVPYRHKLAFQLDVEVLVHPESLLAEAYGRIADRIRSLNPKDIDYLPAPVEDSARRRRVQEMLERPPQESPHSLRGEALAALAEGDQATALALLEALWRHHRRGCTADDGVRLGTLLEASHRMPDAERTYKEVTDSFPDAGPGHMRYAMLLGKLGRWGEAAEHLHRVLERDDSTRHRFAKDAKLRLALARTYFRLGVSAHGEAWRLVHEVLAIAPKDNQALLLAGDIRFVQRRFSEARDLYQQASDLGGGRFSPAFQALGHAALGMREFDVALAMFAQAEQFSPGWAVPHLDRAVVALLRRDHIEARRELGSALGMPSLRPMERELALALESVVAVLDGSATSVSRPGVDWTIWYRQHALLDEFRRTATPAEQDLLGAILAHPPPG